MQIENNAKQSLLIWPQGDKQRVAAIGECMIEITERQGTELSYGFAGDTLNTAIYLAREFAGCEHSIDYVTAVGDDDFSREMVARWAEEGIGTDLVNVIPGELPGLYWVRTDSQGERSFSYWRKETAAQKLIEPRRAFYLTERLGHYDVIYLSGITLAILAPENRDLLLAMLHQLKRSGAIIVFDTNYRPQLWESKEEARNWLTQLTRAANVATVSFDDEQDVFSDDSPEQTITRLHEAGVAEVIVKNGAEACMVSDTREQLKIPLKTIVKQVDTTAAGDSFNAGYLNGRMRGLGLREAVECAQQLSARVVQFPGAVIPK